MPPGGFPASATADVATNQGTTSVTYTDLGTVGPAVTVTTGTKALVIVSALAYNNTSGSQSLMSAAVSGATTLAASDTRAYLVEATANNIPSLGMSSATLITGLTAGSNTFTAKYRREYVSGSATFSQRNITVIDMGS